MNWSEFFFMGGYGVYVWSSWGIALAVLLAIAIVTHWRHRQELDKLKQLVELERDS